MSAIGGPWGPGRFEPAGEAGGEPAMAHPLAGRVGEALGLGLGIAVTEGLRLVPGWNKPVLGSDGKFVARVPGAVREGDYAIRKRHLEVVGPAVAARAKELPPGLFRDFVTGFGIGATQAPGASYRIDARLDDMLHERRRGSERP